LLDGVLVVRIGGLKNLLEVVFGWSGVLLETTLGCYYELLIGVRDLIPDIAIVGGAFAPPSRT
jgi:hypothetical protein